MRHPMCGYDSRVHMPLPARASRSSEPLAYVLGVDIGGSSVKIVLVPRAVDGSLEEPVAHVRWPLPPRAGLRALLDELSRVAGAAGLSGVGLSVPGVVDPTGSHVVRSTNVPWLEGPELVPATVDALGAPVALVNDGEAFALAEARLGPGADSDDVLVLALGTGVAGAHVVGGRVRRGAHGAAGELGHLVLEPDGLPCSCGQHGCLETSIGAANLARRWVSAGGPADGSPETLADAARAGDAIALTVTEHANRALARALLSAVTLIDPGLVVVGGGLAQAPDVYVEPAVALARQWATFQTVPSVLPASLGAWAGARGAALAAPR